MRLVERFGVTATAQARSSDALARAREASRSRLAHASIDPVQKDIVEVRGTPDTYAAIVCIGGPRVATDLASSCRTLLSWLRLGGCLLAAEGFWNRAPDPAYLAATGITAGELQGHGQDIATARDRRVG